MSRKFTMLRTLALALLTLPPLHADWRDLRTSLRLNRSDYFVGEEQVLTLAVTNPTQQPQPLPAFFAQAARFKLSWAVVEDGRFRGWDPIIQDRVDPQPELAGNEEPLAPGATRTYRYYSWQSWAAKRDEPLVIGGPPDRAGRYELALQFGSAAARVEFTVHPLAPQLCAEAEGPAHAGVSGRHPAQAVLALAGPDTNVLLVSTTLRDSVPLCSVPTGEVWHSYAVAKAAPFRRLDYDGTRIRSFTVDVSPLGELTIRVTDEQGRVTTRFVPVEMSPQRKQP